VSVWDAAYIQRLGLQKTFANVWARNERGEITIRQAHDQCDAAVARKVASDRAREARAFAAARADAAEENAKRKARAVANSQKAKEWRAGVAKIMAEVRRREAARKPRFRVPAISRPINPLDGERLWA
tara:strand:+ start:339 stop:722 length:384 start_codon:yes stop_codon:yes gene_type:complete